MGSELEQSDGNAAKYYTIAEVPIANGVQYDSQFHAEKSEKGGACVRSKGIE